MVPEELVGVIAPNGTCPRGVRLFQRVSSRPFSPNADPRASAACTGLPQRDTGTFSGRTIPSWVSSVTVVELYNTIGLIGVNTIAKNDLAKFLQVLA